MSFLIILVAILISLYFIFKKKNPTTKNSVVDIPAYWHELLHNNVQYYEKLNKQEQLRFQKRIQSFLDLVNIEAVGFDLEELDILLVASSAIIPIFNFENWHYPNINTVLIYPDHFNKELQFSEQHQDRNIGGLVGTGRFENQMILSKKALYHGFSNKTDKGNTGVHEFVHLIDKFDGAVDGVPERLMQNQNIMPWLSLMHEKMEDINNDESDIRNYGGTAREEFFAVASEYFFERPQLLKRKHPELYQMLSDCFGK